MIKRVDKTVRGKPKKEAKPVIEEFVSHTKAGHTQAPVKSLVSGPVAN